jgi:tetratricopeptide (TPR) repeat protein
VLSEAAHRARATGEQAVAADASIALASLRLHTAPQASGGQPTMWRELEKLIPLYEASGDAEGLARVLGASGQLRFWAGDTAAAIDDLEQSVHRAREAGDRGQEIESLQYVLMGMLLGPMPAREALARIQELSVGAERNRLLETHALRIRAHLEAMCGRFDTARELIAEAKALAQELGLELTLARLAMQAGDVEMLAGEASAAERELRPAYEVLERMGNLGYLSSIAPRLADALYVQGRDEEAFRYAEVGERASAPEDADAQVGWRRVQAKLLARRGDVLAAERLAREATGLAARTDYLDLHARALADLAEVLRLAGRKEESAVALKEAIRLHERKGNVVAAAVLAGLLTEGPVQV